MSSSRGLPGFLRRSLRRNAEDDEDDETDGGKEATNSIVEAVNDDHAASETAVRNISNDFSKNSPAPAEVTTETKTTAAVTMSH